MKTTTSMCGFARKNQDASHAAVEPDLISATEVDDLPARIICQHLRFQQESRIATPISGFVSLLSTAVSKEFNVLAQLRHSVSGEPLCSALVAISGLAHGEAAVSEDEITMACLGVLMQIRPTTY